MIQEATQSSYLGVICSRCKAQTPISARTAGLYKTAKGDETPGAHDHQPRAFALRCKACNAEGLYDFGAIQDFEGEPRDRASSIKNRTVRRRRTRSTDRL